MTVTANKAPDHCQDLCSPFGPSSEALLRFPQMTDPEEYMVLGKLIVLCITYFIATDLGSNTIIK